MTHSTKKTDVLEVNITTNQNAIDKKSIKNTLERLNQTPAEFAKINTFMKRRAHMNQSAEHALINSQFADIIINHTGVIGELGDVSAIKDLRCLFANAMAPLTLEIGFGMGDSLYEMAKQMPHVNFVGVEVHEAGIGRLAFMAYEANLTNLKLINGDAIALLDNLPKEHLDTVQLYFPDPWQKKRHYKRRFVTKHRMQKVARVLKSGGIFHVATDWEHYAYWIVEVMEAMAEFQNTSGAGNFAVRPDFRPYTKFEKRGINAGHGVWDLLYRKR